MGELPPCRPASPTPPPVDSNRIAVIPFRVSTTDSLLGEGFAELLANEFTGEGSPRSVDMATALAAWRHMGGGLRTPLSQEAARRLARNLGAGLLCEGSIVGLGRRVTITANILNTRDGSARGSPARVTGSADSIDMLLGDVATQLLGTSASGGRRAGQSALTKNPAALRAYLEGMALRRRSRMAEASEAFERSVGEDSTFALPVFARWIIAAAVAPELPLPRGFPRVTALRERLGPRERAVVDAVAGTGVPRSEADVYREIGATAARLEDSPEAWFFYGDRVIHYGLSFLPADSVVPVALRVLGKAVALDSQPLYMSHLVMPAYSGHDTATLRRVVRSLENLPDEWTRRWTAAVVLNDPALIERQRNSRQIRVNGLIHLGDFMYMAGDPVPLRLVDEGAKRLLDAAPALAPEIERLRWYIRRTRGQYDAADRLLGAVPLQPFLGPVGLVPSGALTGEPDLDADLLRRFPETSTPAEARARSCVDALVMLGLGKRDTIAAGPSASSRCGLLIQLWRASQVGPLPDSSMAQLDSITRRTRFSTFLGYEHRLLAREHERRSDLRSALAAIRSTPKDFVGAWLPFTLREEGRIAALLGDTATATRAYKRAIDLLADADPMVRAKRDSMVASLARLRR